MAALAEKLEAEFVCVADGEAAATALKDFFIYENVVGLLVKLRSQGYIESVLDKALTFTHGHWILRLDDDERCSPAMVRWLTSKAYQRAGHWSFARPHFWPDAKTVVLEPGYFPDVQTRLSDRAHAGGRSRVHAGSPFGGGEPAPCCIEHFALIAKTREERIATQQDYARIMGKTWPLSCFETEHDTVQIADYGDGAIPFVVKRPRAVKVNP